jgi:hypothetical protein
VDAGAAGVVVDWERRGKRRRQAGADTQINTHTPDDLTRVRGATSGRVLCRVNRWGPWTPAEIDGAVARGADEVLVPMVRRADEVDGALRSAAGRCAVGILVETMEAARHVDELVRRPLSRVYVGLNDLMIDRGGRCLFSALVDGAVQRVRDAVGAVGLPFGVAGLTVPEGGHPVPCRLLVAELARMDVSFTFLRRSFHADVVGRDVVVEIPRILTAVDAARRRSPAEVAAQRAELAAVVDLLTEDQAV